MDEKDEIAGEEPYLLINALALSLDEMLPLVRQFDGLPIPAHADKDAYSITASLGMIPPEYGFSCIEQKIRKRRFLLTAGESIILTRTILSI